MKYADWSKAPEWANWHAIDSTGDGYWYYDKPELCEYLLCWYKKGKLKFSEVFWERKNKCFVNTLEQRPQEKSYKDQISDVLDAQLAKGQSKYGVTLEDGTLDILATLDHALQESADLLYYLTHIKNLIQKEKQND